LCEKNLHPVQSHTEDTNKTYQFHIIFLHIHLGTKRGQWQEFSKTWGESILIQEEHWVGLEARATLITRTTRTLIPLEPALNAGCTLEVVRS
jgi:hypothetical protein